MGRKIVPLRPRQKKDSPGAPTPLTLADIAITWTEGQSTWATRHYVTGASRARAVLYLRHRHPHTIGHDPLGGHRAGPVVSPGLVLHRVPRCGGAERPAHLPGVRVESQA
jgi:hypothetical protein